MDKRPYIAAVLHAVGLVVVVGTLPVTLPVLAVADVARRSKRFAGVRLLLYVVVILNYEMTALFRAFLGWLRFVGGERTLEEYAEDNFQLQTWFGTKLFWWAARIFDWTVHVQNAQVLKEGPYLLMPRHVSMADTIMWPALVSTPYGIDLHYVLKDELMNDPALGILGQRGRHVFVRRGGADTAAQIARVAALADNLGPAEGVVIYPEGTRHTTLRRARIIKKLEDSGDVARAQEARSLKHLLPPRHGGPIALLRRARDIDVILAPHVGFEGAASLGDLWNGQIIGRRVAVGFRRVSAAEIPRDEEGAAQWLLDQWRTMDLWVERQLYGR